MTRGFDISSGAVAGCTYPHRTRVLLQDIAGIDRSELGDVAHDLLWSDPTNATWQQMKRVLLVLERVLVMTYTSFFSVTSNCSDLDKRPLD